MTEAEYPSLTSGTMTPMVKLRRARKERAKKFGRYLYFRTARKMRSLVSCGIELATGELFRTNETVAGDKASRSASSFKLSGFDPMRTFRSAPFPVLPSVTLPSLAQIESKPQAP